MTAVATPRPLAADGETCSGLTRHVEERARCTVHARNPIPNYSVAGNAYDVQSISNCGRLPLESH